MQESSLAPCCLLVNDGLEMGERGEEGGGGGDDVGLGVGL